MDTDVYKTIETISKGLYKNKGSKFIAFAHPAKNAEEAKIILEEIKKKYHDARHYCYAYKFGYNNDNYRINDDGEPSGTAGKPIYGQILSFGLTNILIVVIRYFGGIKLGVRGLINAYRESAKDAINQASIKESYIKDYYKLTYNYPLMNEVMKLLKDDRIEQIKTKFEINCEITISYRQKFSQEITKNLQNIHGLKTKYLYTI